MHIPDMPQMPIHDALDLKQSEQNTIRDFLDWLDNHNYAICEKRDEKYEPGAGYVVGGYYPAQKDESEWIVESLGFDHKAWMAEKDALAKALMQR